METLTYAGTLVVRTCWCGMRHAIPEELASAATKDKHISVHCPIGHEWVSSEHEKRESQRLREQLERERDSRARVQSSLDQERAHSRALKGVVTKTKKKLSATEQRAAAGVCPCCNRTFQQLARHMQTKHPDFEPERAA